MRHSFCPDGGPGAHGIRAVPRLLTVTITLLMVACGGGDIPGPSNQFPPPPPPPAPPPPPTPTVGSLRVTTHTINLHLAQGAAYTLSINGASTQAVGRDTTLVLANVAVGNHTITVTGVPGGCRATTRTVTVVGGEQVDAGVIVVCSAGPPGPGRVAFSSLRDDNWEVYVMNTDGTGLANLTRNPANDNYASWSPDGIRLAFVSYRSGNADIWVMNADGSDPARLTFTVALDDNPSWSPDGTRILFDSSRQLFTVRPDGTMLTRLTESAGCDELGTWSPDATRVLFSASTAGCNASTFDLHTVNADGTERRLFLARPGHDFYSDWSPDGRKILLDGPGSGDATARSRIWLMNADGSGPPVALTPGSANDTAPRWSPDGTQIVFVSDRDGNREIYLMDADGTSARRLTVNPARDDWPAWKR